MLASAIRHKPSMVHVREGTEIMFYKQHGIDTNIQCRFDSYKGFGICCFFKMLTKAIIHVSELNSTCGKRIAIIVNGLTFAVHYSHGGEICSFYIAI